MAQRIDFLLFFFTASAGALLFSLGEAIRFGDHRPGTKGMGMHLGFVFFRFVRFGFGFGFRVAGFGGVGCLRSTTLPTRRKGKCAKEQTDERDQK